MMLGSESPCPSALQRSKTAPTPLVDSPGASAARWGGKELADRIDRSKARSIGKPNGRSAAKYVDGGALGDAARPRAFDSTLDGVVAAQTDVDGRGRLVSPRHEVQEDPFSLAGFFPSRPGSPGHAVEWAWRSAAEDSTSAPEREGDGWSSGRPLRTVSLTGLDEYAREVIAKESAVGIVGLGARVRVRVPSFLKAISDGYFGKADDDVSQLQISAAAIDEPFDADSLSESMHARRVASQRDLSLTHADADLVRVPSLGLFGAAAETREAELGWTSALYTRILEDSESEA